MSSQDAAEWLVRAHEAGGDFAPLPENLRARDLDAAYHIQEAFQAIAGRGRIAGYKIALASRAMQEMVGIDQPIAGGIFEGDIHQSGVRIPRASFGRLGLEFELAFRFADAIRAPVTREDMLSRVSECYPAFELIEDRNADYANLDARDLVADNSWCGGVVLGAPIPDWQGAGVEAIASRLNFNDEIEEGNTSAAEPFNSLAWVVAHVLSRGGTIAAGDIVITGSALRTRFPQAGDVARYDIGGLSAVEVFIT